MADSPEDRRLADRIAEFGEWIEQRRKQDVGSEWANAAEEEKLREIFWESCSVSHGFTVPGAAVLAAIERNVDTAGLPAVQQEMLKDIRRRLDAGQLDGSQSEKRDLVGTALEQIVDAGFFEESVRVARESKDHPWADISADEKVRLLIQMAHDSGVWTDWWDDLDGTTPGAHVLATIEREIDYPTLAPWRREGLESVRAQVDAGELVGENPNPSGRTDRVGYALRMAELEAGIEDFKHIDDGDRDPGRYRRWGDMAEEAKLNEIMHVVQALHLGNEPEAYQVIAREVDMSRLPKETQREFERRRAGAWRNGEESPSRAEMEAFASSVLADGFNWAPELGLLTRPGPEETPLERVERQIGHIKVLPDPDDFRIEELGPWDTEVSEEWKRLPEVDKLARLVRQVDWREISAEDKHRLLEREVDLAQVPGEALKQIEGDAPREEYQVWHDRGWPQSRINQMLGGWPDSRFPQEYFHAADVRAGTLQEAVQLTTSSGTVLGGDHQPWDDNRGVRSHTPEPFVPRDTDAGDVIVDPQGQAHRYDGRGFQAIEAAARQHVPPAGSNAAELDGKAPASNDRTAVPTRSQMEIVVGQIKDVVGADYVQRRGEEFAEKLFPWLEPAEKIALLEKHVHWKGFDDAQKQSVIQRVLDDEKPESWMDGIEAAPRRLVASGIEQGQAAGSQPGREAKRAAVPPHPWPSEIARANRQKQPEAGQGHDSGQDKSNHHDDGHSM